MIRPSVPFTEEEPTTTARFSRGSLAVLVPLEAALLLRITASSATRSARALRRACKRFTRPPARGRSKPATLLAHALIFNGASELPPVRRIGVLELFEGALDGLEEGFGHAVRPGERDGVLHDQTRQCAEAALSCAV